MYVNNRKLFDWSKPAAFTALKQQYIDEQNQGLRLHSIRSKKPASFGALKKVPYVRE